MILCQRFVLLVVLKARGSCVLPLINLDKCITEVELYIYSNVK